VPGVSATLAAEVFAAWQGADYIRTHDTCALALAGAVASAPRDGIALTSGHRTAVPSARTPGTITPHHRRAQLPEEVRSGPQRPAVLPRSSVTPGQYV
jgi:hypothetical protein